MIEISVINKYGQLICRNVIENGVIKGPKDLDFLQKSKAVLTQFYLVHIKIGDTEFFEKVFLK